MARLIEFSRRMRRLADRFSRNVFERTNEAARAVTETVVFFTPVKTGAARSNWRASLDAPLTNTIAPHAPLVRGDREETANFRAAVQAANAVIAQRRRGQALFLSNNLEHIEELNNGSSRQSAAGFVERAIRAGNDIIKKPGYLR